MLRRLPKSGIVMDFGKMILERVNTVEEYSELKEFWLEDIHLMKWPFPVRALATPGAEDRFDFDTVHPWEWARTRIKYEEK